MKAQRIDVDVSRLLQGATYPDAVSCPASGKDIAESMQALCRKLRQRFPDRPSRIEHRLNWFIGLYLASLLSFSGLIAAVRSMLELL